MKECANIVVGEGKRVRGLSSCHTQGSGDCPVPLPKTVRRAKSFKEAYSTDEVARQTCTVFGSSTSEGVTKTPPVPLSPSSRGYS